MLRRLLALLCVSVPLLLCSCASLPDKVVSSADRAEATHYIDLLQQRNFAQLTESMDPAIVTSDLGERLGQIADLFPKGEPSSKKVTGIYVGAKASLGESYTTRDISLEYQFSDRFLEITINSKHNDQGTFITGFSVDTLSHSLAYFNRFTLLGKTPVHYFILLSAVGIEGLVLFAFVLCLRTKNVKRKWLWAIFTLFGIVQLKFNWTTGDLSYKLFHFVVPAGTFSGGGYAPVLLYISFPVGALVFLWKLSSRSRSPMATVDSAPQTVPFDVD